jgi:glycosyltransferase involved in cell wall biosynthesis
MDYKILTISWDPTLAMDNPKFGDVQARNIEYGKKVVAIHSITYSKKKLKLKNKQLSKNVFVYPTNSMRPITFLFGAWKLAKEICKNNEIDLVLTQDPFLTGLVGTWVKKKFGCKLLVHYHGDFWHNKNWVKEAWYNRFLNISQSMVLKRTDAIRVMSEGQQEKFIKTGWAKNRVRVISTPVDLKKYQRRSDTNNQMSNTVLHVGRDDEVKDYDTLVKAFKLVKEKVSEVKFLQAGAGEKLKKAMKENNFFDVDVKGTVKHSSLIDLYHQSSLFVLSSTSESFGKVLVEANACARPVVSTITTGAKEIVKDGTNGYLVPIGDSESLANRIIELLNNPQKAKEMGDNGKKMMQEQYGDNTEKIVQFWRDIINNKLK